jgi:voltage-gated potassium channel
MIATDASGAPPEADLDDPTGRLASYLAWTQTPLDILALVTLWLVVVPPWDFGPRASTVVWVARTGLSVLYGIDFTIRASLARRHWHYVRHHLLGIVVVVLPPLRIVFSLRLVRSLFRRGHLERFLAAGLILVLNGAVAVYLYERNAPGSNIHTLGQAVWWAMTTVSTVGYGDYTPVTTRGRIIAVGIMAVGIVTLAVLTAQVASSFVTQSSRPQTGSAPGSEENTGVVTLADLAMRLDRIETLLTIPGGGQGPSSDEP